MKLWPWRKGRSTVASSNTAVSNAGPSPRTAQAPPDSLERAQLCVASPGDADPLAEAMNRWLKVLHGRLDGRGILLMGPEASPGNVKEWLRDNRRRPILFVFYGHGCRDGFLTERCDCEGSAGKCSYLCEARDFANQFDVQLVAYCCLSGSQMVHDLAAFTSARSISFTDEIGFVLGSAERERAFSGPIGDAVVAVSRTGHIDELTLHDVREQYYKELRCWMPGGDRGRDTRALLVSMMLRQHASLVQIA